MKVIGINCSPRKGKSTYEALVECMNGVQDAGPEIETEIIELAGKVIQGCSACGYCKKALACSIEDDFQDILPKLADAELAGLVIGTPVYLGTMTSQCKALIDRSVVLRRNGSRFRNLAGGALATGGVRSGGQELTIQAVHAALLIHDMLIVGDGMDTSHFGGTLWNAGDKGLAQDEFGLKTARNLGSRIGEVCLRMANGQ